MCGFLRADFFDRRPEPRDRRACASFEQAGEWAIGPARNGVVRAAPVPTDAGRCSAESFGHGSVLSHWLMPTPDAEKIKKPSRVIGRAWGRLMPAARRRNYPVRSDSLRSGRGIRVKSCVRTKVTAKFSLHDADNISGCRTPDRRDQSKFAGEDHMPIEDDDRPRKKITHEIGQDLSLLSVEELSERIALLNSEVDRLKEAMSKKRASKDAANAFFKS
jgi:uncharacterized small protein (DUF1192 family)